MAERIDRPKMLGNFKPSLLQRAREKPTALDRRKRREGNSEAHREFIRKLPCLITGKMPCGSGHHLKSGPAAPERGMGMKATDRWLLPLSFEPHMGGKGAVESLASTRELEWFKAHGVDDPYALAAALYRHTGELDIGTKIVIEAKRGKPR